MTGIDAVARTDAVTGIDAVAQTDTMTGVDAVARTDAAARVDATTGPTCGAAVFLRSGGPVQVPFRLCCAVALLHAARAAEAPPPPCPRRADLLGTVVSVDLLVALAAGTRNGGAAPVTPPRETCPTVIERGSEVLP